MQKRQICFHSVAFALFLAAGGLVSAVLKFELIYDYLLYHHYNGFAFLNGRLLADIAPASVATYYNPLLDTVFYLLNEGAGKNITLYYFLTGLPFGALMFLVFELSLLFFDPRTTKGKICSAAAVLIASTGVATWFQIGTITHEITISVFVLAALFFYLKYPDKKSTYLIGGFLLGAAAGLKLTAVIYCVSMGITLLLSFKSLSKPKTFIALLAAGGLAGFLTTNGFWMITLWQNFQNPVFPFWNAVFKSPYYLDHNYVDTLHLENVRWYELVFLPFYLIVHPFSSPIGVLQELSDLRLSALFFIGIGFGLSFLKKEKPVLSFRMKQLAVWLFCSYAVWITISANLRFTVPIETMAAIIITVVLARPKKPDGMIKEAVYFSFLITVTWAFVSTTCLSAPWGSRTQPQLLEEKVVLPENTVLKVHRFPLAAIAAEIAKDNPDVKIILISPSDEKWYGWDMAHTGKMKKRTDALIKSATTEAALFQDAFNMVRAEAPYLNDWQCRSLKISQELKMILFSKVELCLPPENKVEEIKDKK